MKTAEDVLKLIEDLDTEERWKLLSMLYDQYYNSADQELTNDYSELLDY